MARCLTVPYPSACSNESIAEPHTHARYCWARSLQLVFALVTRLGICNRRTDSFLYLTLPRPTRMGSSHKICVQAGEGKLHVFWRFESCEYPSVENGRVSNRSLVRRIRRELSLTCLFAMIPRHFGR